MKILSKTCIGKLYTKIDPYLGKFRPDNAYRYVDRLVRKSIPGVHVVHCQPLKQYDVGTENFLDGCESPHFQCQQNCSEEVKDSTQGEKAEEAPLETGSCPPPPKKKTVALSAQTSPPPTQPLPSSSSTPPMFNLPKARRQEVVVDAAASTKKLSYKPRNINRREYRSKLKIKSLQRCIKNKDGEIRKLKKLVQKKDCTVQKLQETVDTTSLKLATAEKVILKNQCASQRMIQKLQKALDSVSSDYGALEDSFEALQDSFEALQAENAHLKSTIVTMQNEWETEKEGILIESKSGRHYSPAIRKLYYTLLANQVPAARIRDIVLTVLECFVPDCDISSIKLPKERCAGYMRREELATIGMAQKAHLLCEQIRCGKPFHLNSDGTTKNQHKINGVAVSVNEVSDGSAETIVEDIGKELDKLRETAHQLHLPNADSINWTLFSSSSADS